MPLSISYGDITQMNIQAVVNPTDIYLSGSGGLDNTIHKLAGKKLREQCDRIGSLAEGSAVLTAGYNLKAQYIIHTAGPVWMGGEYGESTVLSDCYHSIFRLCIEKDITSVAIPLISAGNNGYPSTRAFHIAYNEISRALDGEDIDVTLVLFEKPVSTRPLSDYLNYDVISGNDVIGANPPSLRIENKAAPDICRQRLDDINEDARPGLLQSHRNKAALPDLLKRGKIRKGRSSPDSGLQKKSAKIYEDATAEENYLPDEAQLFAAEFHRESCDSAPPPLLEDDAVFSVLEPCESMAEAHPVTRKDDLDSLIKNADEPFSATLFSLIDKKGLSDSECYTRANVSRKLFSKIRCNSGYHPEKRTVLAFAVALCLSYGETEALLKKAGYAFTDCEVFDIVVAYYIRERIYDISVINEALFEHDQVLLGSFARE